jgi:hypothetical protein
MRSLRTALARLQQQIRPEGAVILLPLGADEDVDDDAIDRRAERQLGRPLRSDDRIAILTRF